jgi:hypothetical protein
LFRWPDDEVSNSGRCFHLAASPEIKLSARHCHD